MENTESYPTCERCHHDWHGLECLASVVTIVRLGRRTDRCGCAPAEHPGAHTAA